MAVAPPPYCRFPDEIPKFGEALGSGLQERPRLTHLLAEDRAPPEALWEPPLVASRLLEYEMWPRVHAARLGHSHGDAVRELISRVALIEPAPAVLARALEPFPLPVRTLDALHLASIEFLRARRLMVDLASYDEQLLAAARALGIPLYEG